MELDWTNCIEAEHRGYRIRYLVTDRPAPDLLLLKTDITPLEGAQQPEFPTELHPGMGTYFRGSEAEAEAIVLHLLRERVDWLCRLHSA